MRLVRDRADTWWAPARFHHALFRLMALGVASRLGVERRPAIVRVIDRDQNPIESYAIALWCLATCACYFFALLSPAIGLVAATLASVLLAAIAIHVIIVGFGLLAGLVLRDHDRDRTRIVTALTMLVLGGVAVWVSTLASWVRHAGRAFLLALLLNAVAAVLLGVLRAQVDAIDRERGALE